MEKTKPRTKSEIKREKYLRYLRSYYRNKVKPSLQQKREREQRTHLKVQMVEYVKVNKDNYVNYMKKQKRFKPYLFGYFFFSRKSDLIPIESCYTNKDMAKWVCENYGEGIWSMRFVSYSTSSFYYAKYREVLKLQVNQDKTDFTFKILKVRTRRLNRYWFRKPEFQRKLKKEQL